MERNNIFIFAVIILGALGLTFINTVYNNMQTAGNELLSNLTSSAINNSSITNIPVYNLDGTFYKKSASQVLIYGQIKTKMKKDDVKQIEYSDTILVSKKCPTSAPLSTNWHPYNQSSSKSNPAITITTKGNNCLWFRVLTYDNQATEPLGINVKITK